MRRIVVCAAVAVALAGCGSDKTQSRSNDVGTRGKGPTTGPYLFDIPGALDSLKKQGIDAQQTHASDRVASHALPAPEKSGTYEAGGTPFTLLLFPSEDLANDAAGSLGKTDGEVVIGKNILAVIQGRGRDVNRLRSAVSALGDNPPGPEPGFPAKGEPDS